jgi:hypothetical protein
MGKLKRLRAELRAEYKAAKEELIRLSTLLNDYKYGNGEEFEDNFAIESAMGDVSLMMEGLKAEIADLKPKKSTAKSKKGGGRKKTRRNRQ